MLPTTLSLPASFTVERRFTFPHALREVLSMRGRIVILAGQTVAEIDSSTGKATSRFVGHDIAELVTRGARLWVLEGSASDAPRPRAARLVELSPPDLAVDADVTLPRDAVDGVVAAGGRLWVGGIGRLLSVDPGRGTVVRLVEVRGAAGRRVPVVVGASTDGRALWTTTTPVDGGRISVQVRDPASGQVVAAGRTRFEGIGVSAIAASDGHAWLSVPTGMMGSYLRIDRHGTRLVEAPRKTAEGVASWTNGVRTWLIAGRLWTLDGQTVTVSDDATGRPMARAPFLNGSGVAAWTAGRVLLSRGRQLLVVALRRR